MLIVNQRLARYVKLSITGYRAPAILVGPAFYKSIDMWSCGCVVVEMASGHPLFPGYNEFDQLR
jgi:mitogen-activated protein kinase 7